MQWPNLPSGLLDVVERCGQSVLNLPSDFAARLLHGIMDSLHGVALQICLASLNPPPLSLQSFDCGTGLLLYLQRRVYGPLLQLRQLLDLFTQSMLRIVLDQYGRVLYRVD